MAKKFGKFLFLTAAVGTAAAAAYYYMQKKDPVADTPEDEDYDDFSDDFDDNAESSRNYVALNAEAPKTASTAEENTEVKDAEEKDIENKDTFTPLTEQVKKAEETVEEFFDEEDPAEDSASAGGN